VTTYKNEAKFTKLEKINLHFSSQNLNLYVFLNTNQQKIERDIIKYFNLAFKNIFFKCSAVLSTVRAEVAQKVLMESGKAYVEDG
jgi:hypothetical protein